MYTFIKKNLLLIGVVACLYPLQVSAQDKLSVHAKADFVSDYVWRGADQQSGCSVQPSLTLGYAGFSLNVWGSQSLTKWEEGGSKEWDINLGYTYRNLTATLSDYWWSGINQPYGHYKNSHYFEGYIWLTASAILFRCPFHGAPCLPGQTRMRRAICRHLLTFRPPIPSGYLLT